MGSEPLNIAKDSLVFRHSLMMKLPAVHRRGVAVIGEIL